VTTLCVLVATVLYFIFRLKPHLSSTKIPVKRRSYIKSQSHLSMAIQAGCYKQTHKADLITCQKEFHLQEAHAQVTDCTIKNQLMTGLTGPRLLTEICSGADTQLKCSCNSPGYVCRMPSALSQNSWQSSNQLT